MAPRKPHFLPADFLGARPEPCSGEEAGAHLEQSTSQGMRLRAPVPQAGLGRWPPLASGSSCLLLYGVLELALLCSPVEADNLTQQHPRRDKALATWDQAVFKKVLFKIYFLSSWLLTGSTHMVG